MRVAVYFAFCLVLNVTNAQFSNPRPSIATPESQFDCKNLTTHVQNLSESTRSKKDKFSCILNLLKSALSEELENAICQESQDVKDLRNSRNFIEENENVENRLISEIETKPDENTAGIERELFDKLVSKITQSKTKNATCHTQNSDIPTMIPIFKPRPMVKTELKPNPVDCNPAKPNLRSPAHEQHKLNPTHSIPRFTIPCQRAADVLDMSNVPREIKRNVQPIVKPIAPVPSSNIPKQTPGVSVHCTDLDETITMLFKPKAISLMQVYGNLLKKVTITVLVPYHMSKLGQQ